MTHDNTNDPTRPERRGTPLSESDIVAAAKNLPVLTPARDLWTEIESRIATEVVQLPVTGETAAIVAPVTVADAPLPMVAHRDPMVLRRWRLAAAASVLVAATAGITWTVAERATGAQNFAADSAFAEAMAGTVNARVVSRGAVNETYDREIATLRRLVDERRADLDSATVAVLEHSLQVIDQAIAESKAALAASPASAFLLDRLTDAYDSKLRTLRAVAAITPRA